MKWTRDDITAVIAAITLAIMLPLAGAALALFLMPLNKALSHSFYDPECCSDKDCAPIEARNVKVTDSGYVVTVGPGDHPMIKHAPISVVVPYANARESPDGRYHACFTEQHVSPDGTAQFGASLLCFYRPPMSY